jgi:hypothetical protein
MRSRVALLVGVVLLAGLAAPETADSDDRHRRFRARLLGRNEVPTVSSTGTGDFRATVDRHDATLTYRLSYENLEGTVTMSHIHLGQVSVNGGIMIWLCGTPTVGPNDTTGPAGTPTCPAPGGTVSRTVGPADVIGPSGQGIAAGEFAEAIRALRRGLGYANVHTTKHGGGEIRGQITESGDRDD